MSSKPSNLPKTADGATQAAQGSGSPYARLFRLKGAKAFCLSAAFARLPMSMMSLGIVLALNHLYDNWTVAGAMSAVYILAVAAVTPFYARLFDRFGQVKVGRVALTVQVIVMLAFAFVLCLFPLASLPYGGTITACSMLPVVIIAYRYGWKWGLLTGFVFSLLQIVEGGIGTLSAFTKTPGSFLLVFFLDYVIAFTVLGLAGVFRGRIKSQRAELVAGTVLVCLLRYACHFLSGITVWRDISIPMAGAVPFSLIYNATYMLPETIITVLGAFMIGGVLDFRREMVGRAPKQERQPLSAVILFAAATVLFLAGLVFDTAHIFSHLQNPDTGVFDITGITGCNWTLVITVTAVALVLSGAALIIRKILLSRQRLPLRRSPEQK